MASSPLGHSISITLSNLPERSNESGRQYLSFAVARTNTSESLHVSIPACTATYSSASGCFSSSLANLSKSSRKTIARPSAFASAKTSQITLTKSPSGLSFLIVNDLQPLSSIKHLAINDFPTPGLPQSITPLGMWTPNRSYFSGFLTTSQTRISSALMSSYPTTLSNLLIRNSPLCNVHFVVVVTVATMILKALYRNPCAFFYT